ncbi:hypothetical protein J6590_068932 [Homalodisca vitripennis]|nr:hypothetical protein J6590_068932 [Homalodisca vitripennis]
MDTRTHQTYVLATVNKHLAQRWGCHSTHTDRALLVIFTPQQPLSHATMSPFPDCCKMETCTADT